MTNPGDRPAYPTGNKHESGMTVRQAYKVAALHFLAVSQPGLTPEQVPAVAATIADGLIQEDEARDQG